MALAKVCRVFGGITATARMITYTVSIPGKYFSGLSPASQAHQP